MIHYENIRAVHGDCLCGNELWLSDTVIGGLYRTNIVTFETVDIISPMEIYEQGLFKPIAVLQYADNIIIVPYKSEYQWIIYNKISNTFFSKKIIAGEFFISKAVLIENIVYVIPLVSDDPIVSFAIEDLLSQDNEFSINIHHIPVERKPIWKALKYDDSIYVPIRECNLVIKINEKGMQYIRINDNINDIAILNGLIVVLPMGNNALIFYEPNGNFVKQIDLNESFKKDYLGNEFCQIVSAEKYIFFLHRFNEQIGIYDSERNEIIDVVIKGVRIKNNIIKDENYPPYWGSILRERSLLLLPGNAKFCEISLNDLSAVQKDVFFPESVNFLKECFSKSFASIGRQVFQEGEYPLSVKEYVDSIETKEKKILLKTKIGWNIYTHLKKDMK